MTSNNSEWRLSAAVNLQPIQLHVREELTAWMGLDERDFFTRNHQEFVEDLRTEQYIDGNNWKPNYKCFDDYAIVSDIAKFLDDLELWNREIAVIRDQYFWDKGTSELPDAYLWVFGHTSTVVEHLKYLKSRCKEIIDGIDSSLSKADRAKESTTKKEVELSRLIPKAEARKLIGVAETKFRKMLKAGELGLVSVPNSQMVRMHQSEYKKLTE